MLASLCGALLTVPAGRQNETVATLRALLAEKEAQDDERLQEIFELKQSYVDALVR